MVTLLEEWGVLVNINVNLPVILFMFLLAVCLVYRALYDVHLNMHVA